MLKETIILDNGISLNKGVNRGEYPLHHFNVLNYDESILRLPLKVDFSGWDEWIEGCWRERSNSEVFALEFIREGGMSFIQRGRKFQLSGDSLFIVHEGEDNKIYMENFKYCRKMTLALSGPLLRPLLASLGLLEISALEISKPEKLENMMLEIIRTADSREREAKLKLSERAYAILLFISSENRMKKYPSNLIKALELFEKNIHNSLSVDQICFFLGISQPTLSRLFKKYIHISPMAYFIEQKMRTAKMLLRDHSLSIKEIAQAVGYSNQLYFSAEFRKRTGVSPKFFREKRKK